MQGGFFAICFAVPHFRETVSLTGLKTLIVISIFSEDSWVKQGSLKDTFYINHCQGSLPVLYNARGWLKVAREHATVKQAHPILAESSK